MALPRLQDDLAVISKLGDYPATDDNLTTAEFKAKFDEAALRIQEFLNKRLIPVIEMSGGGSGGGSVETDEDGKAHISGDGNTIVNVGTPEKDTDAANKGYVDTTVEKVITEKVIHVETKADGTKEEHVSGGGNTIVNVAAPVENTDAVNKAYADAIKKTAEAAVKRAGDTMQGILNFGGFQGKGVAAPTEGTDVVNKDYADAGSVARDILFVNADLETEYAAQTIAHSGMDDYDDAHIELATDCGDTYGVFYYTEMVKEPVGKQIVIYKTLVYGETVAQVFRTFTFTSTGITVGDCYTYNTDGSIAKMNKALIPTKIEGIKYGKGGGSAASAEGVLF